MRGAVGIVHDSMNVEAAEDERVGRLRFEGALQRFGHRNPIGRSEARA